MSVLLTMPCSRSHLVLCMRFGHVCIVDNALLNNKILTNSNSVGSMLLPESNSVGTCPNRFLHPSRSHLVLCMRFGCVCMVDNALLNNKTLTNSNSVGSMLLPESNSVGTCPNRFLHPSCSHLVLCARFGRVCVVDNALLNNKTLTNSNSVGSMLLPESNSVGRIW